MHGLEVLILTKFIKCASSLLGAELDAEERLEVVLDANQAPLRRRVLVELASVDFAPSIQLLFLDLVAPMIVVRPEQITAVFATGELLA